MDTFDEESIGSIISLGNEEAIALLDELADDDDWHDVLNYMVEGGYCATLHTAVGGPVAGFLVEPGQPVQHFRTTFGAYPSTLSTTLNQEERLVLRFRDDVMQVRVIESTADLMDYPGAIDAYEYLVERIESAVDPDENRSVTGSDDDAGIAVARTSAESCCICCEVFEKHEKLMVFACGHAQHRACYAKNARSNPRFESTCCVCHQKSRPCYQTLGAADGDEDPCAVLSDSDYEADHADGMQIFVCNNGVAKRFFVQSKSTVQDLKALISLKLHIPAHIFFLSFAGKLLSDDGKSLSDYAIVRDSQIMLDIRGFGGSPKKKQKAVVNKSDLIDDLLLEIDNLTRQVVGDNDPLVQEIIQYFTGVRQALQGREPAECFATYARLLSDTDLEKVSAIGMGNGNPDYKVDAIAKIFFHGAFKSIRMKRDRLCVLESILSTTMKQIMVEKFFCDGSFNWSSDNDSSFAKTMTRLIIDKAKAEATAMQT
jgi:hypothetical protein